MIKIHNMTKQHLQRLKVRLYDLICICSHRFPIMTFNWFVCDILDSFQPYQFLLQVENILLNKLFAVPTPVQRFASAQIFRHPKIINYRNNNSVNFSFSESGSNLTPSKELSRRCFSDSKADTCFGPKGRRNQNIKRKNLNIGKGKGMESKSFAQVVIKTELF